MNLVKAGNFFLCKRVPICGMAFIEYLGTIVLEDNKHTIELFYYFTLQYLMSTWCKYKHVTD